VAPLLDRVVEHLTANRDRWHRAMVHDELGVVEDTRINPWLEGVQIGLSFVIGGLIPTVPLLFALPQARWWAYGLSTLTALVLGAIKTHYTGQHPVRASLEFLPILTLGTLGGVGIGLLLHAA
jgi:vacuolar iron transporter family protein